MNIPLGRLIILWSGYIVQLINAFLLLQKGSNPISSGVFTYTNPVEHCNKKQMRVFFYTTDQFFIYIYEFLLSYIIIIII